MRYMHLSPSAREGAIRLLDEARQEAARSDGRGEMLETAANWSELSENRVEAPGIELDRGLPKT